MYARKQTRPKPLKSESTQWPAPVAGWISNRMLASPDSIEGPGAAVLDNFFPRPTGIQLRRGKDLYATFEDTTLDVLSLFTYHNGNIEQMFGANANTIYDLSNIPFPSGGTLATEDAEDIETENGDVFGWTSTGGYDVSTGYTGGDWSVVQFATTGGVYLIGVNGEDTGFIYDGSVFYPLVEGGVSRLNYDAETTPFADGETVTGGTSGATATIFRAVDEGATGYILVTGISGTFQDNELLTSATGSATANGAPSVAAPGIDFGGLTSADMSFVWSYKNRLWFIQKESLNVYYMADVDQVGGTATLLPLGGVFSNGGSLMFGARWSMENSGDGGLSDQNVFVTNFGEAAVFQGSNPEDANDWALVGVYRTGAPLGKKAYLRGGGDLAICTDVGLVPLSKAISLDITALNVATISYKIADAWSDAIRFRGTQNWQAYVWSQGKMALIAPPDLIGSSFPVVFVTNTETGAWARYTNWQANCFTIYRGELYFGSPNGQVFKGNTTGTDDGQPYTGTVISLYDDIGAPASAKIGKMARAVTRSNFPISDRVTIRTNYDVTIPSAPDAQAIFGDNAWGSGVWGTSIWGAEIPEAFQANWKSAGGIGHVIAPCYQVTSGSLSPLDVQLISMDTTCTKAATVT